jgi:phospholipid/cholesterol/gamma-HCH transport system substrate-binding protein
METEKYYFRVGVFFLLVTACFVFYLINFGNGETGSMTRYAVYFDNSVAGLARGAPVKLKGIAVGLVNEINFVAKDSDRILVVIDVSETAPIRKDTVASIAFQGITGTTYLSLENTNPEATPVYLKKEKGEKYPVIASEKSGFQTVMANAPELMGGLAKTATQAQKLLSDGNVAAVQVLIAEATSALREIKMLARTLRDDPSIILRGTNYEGYKVQK